MTTKTCLFPYEIREIPAQLVAEGIQLGLVKIIHFGQFEIIEKNCTDCGETLPSIVCTNTKPQWSTFPRCSRHAF